MTKVRRPPRTPRVSIITPAYNVARYLGETVDSVLQQSFTDFEYLIVDDGSNDDTAEVARGHAGDDPRLRLLTGEHTGPGHARNVGIQNSSGKYIAFLDGDDRWRPRFLEHQVALIESLPSYVGAVFCRSFITLESGIAVFVQRQRAGWYDFDDFLVGNNPARNGSSLLIRRSCFDDVGLFDEKLSSAQDLDMWLRIAERSNSPVLCASRRYLVYMRLRPGSVSRDHSARAAALDGILTTYSARLRRLSPALAYVRPALDALQYGYDDVLTRRWGAAARSVGVARLAHSGVGLRFLFWHSMPAPTRSCLRELNCAIREAVKSAIRRVLPGGNRVGVA